MCNIIRLISFLLVIVSLTACKVGPDFEPAEAPDTQSYTETPMPNETVSTKGHAGKSQAFAVDRDIPAEWWKLFHSKSLNYLIERGIAYNQNIEAATAALKVAKQNYLAGVGALFPTVGLQGSAQRQKFSNAAFGQNNINPTTGTTTATDIPDSTFSLYNASVNVSYLLDVFGGTRRNIEALCAQVDYQRYVLEGAYLSLTANIVTGAITEASLRAQIQATQELIQLQEETLKIVETQFTLGGVSRGDVLTQETLLGQTRATLPPLEKALAQNRHALAVLVGDLPSESCLPEFFLKNLNLPAELPVSLPSELVNQRPDIKAQEALVHQASALIGVAVANMLPQFTLTGSYGYEANTFNKLFNSNNIIWNYGAQVLQPVFQGGTLVAKRRAAIYTFEQTAAQYRQTVLVAFQNVADSLRALEVDARTLKAQTLAEESAFQALKLTKQQFQLGAINYLLLLIAERQYHEARILRIRAEALRYSDTVALFQSLGGGWWNCAEFLKTKKCSVIYTQSE